jgi:hypothetical protein
MALPGAARDKCVGDEGVEVRSIFARTVVVRAKYRKKDTDITPGCALVLNNMETDLERILLILWVIVENTWFSTTKSDHCLTRYHLVTEQLLLHPRQWDWSVWRADGQTAPVRHGGAASALAARADAETAARRWDISERFRRLARGRW